MPDKILDVPFYNQLDQQDLPEEWRPNACGLLALKMVMDFWHPDKPANLKQLLGETLADHGYLDDVGWYHSALVRAAQRQGFNSFRRSWNVSGDNKDKFSEEGVNDRSLEAYADQMEQEAYPTLVAELEEGNPVIVAVAKDFDDIEKGHLVVLTGVKREDALGRYLGFFYNDPYSPTKTERKDRYVSIKRFQEKWNRRAIFIKPANE